MNLDYKKIQALSTPEILENPLVVYLLEVCKQQSEMLSEFKEENRRLKNHPPKPNIKPSRVEAPNNKPLAGKRPGSEKRKKTDKLEISKVEIIEAEGVCPDWKFKGYSNYVVQEIIIKPYNIRYRLKRYLTPEGKYVKAQLPTEVQGSHFGAELRKFVLYQYYNCYVTEPILLVQLRELGIDISAGQLNNLLIKDHDQFHAEKEGLLRRGLELCPYIQSDDTGSRHAGKNGYCTVICNDFFTYFKSGESKSRINFLKLLRTSDRTDYHINEYALSYFQQQKLPLKYQGLLKSSAPCQFPDEQTWNDHLERLGVKAEHAVRVATEGALLGSIIENVANTNLAILSDDAGQFNILFHALCWVHAERHIQKVHCFTPQQEEILETKLDGFWQLYQDLKAYKENPSIDKKRELNIRFDEVFRPDTDFWALNQTLEKIVKNKDELLLVLERPEIPLHNNTSERDIREYVKRRKISGSTRSDSGKECRDTFLSLKKTCLKLGYRFWEYLDDRIKNENKIPNLSDIMTVKLTSTF